MKMKLRKSEKDKKKKPQHLPSPTKKEKMRSMKDQSREPDIDLLEKRTEENEEVNNKKK